MPRFFVPPEQLPKITGSDAHQIKNVLRMKVGDELELLDGTGKIYQAKITEIKIDRVFCEIIRSWLPATGYRLQITIAQCLPKAKKMDLIVQKCTELGAARIIPTLSERTVAKGGKADRWQKIAREAAEQSGRAEIPRIDPLTGFSDVLKLAGNFDLALIPWELEKGISIKKPLTDPRISGYPDILITIGPEGGFSRREVDQAVAAGFTPVSLGPRVLRTETAGIAIMAMINYQFEL